MGELINGRTPDEIKAAVINCDEHCSCIDCPEDERDYCDQSVVIKYARLLIERLEAERDAALAKVPKWISVEERLPEEDGKYIVRTEKNSVYSTKSRTGYGRGGFGCDINTHITHWMTMPEPPKEEAHND